MGLHLLSLLIPVGEVILDQQHVEERVDIDRKIEGDYEKQNHHQSQHVQLQHKGVKEQVQGLGDVEDRQELKRVADWVPETDETSH